MGQTKVSYPQTRRGERLTSWCHLRVNLQGWLSLRIDPPNSPKLPGSCKTQAERRVSTGIGRPRPRELNHLFVSNVRFWCMLAIVLLHCLSAFGMINPQSHLIIALVTPLKFGTIGFFLISGFLLGERVDRRNPVEYFMRRFNRLFVPWALWFAVACAVLMAGVAASHHGGALSNTSEYFQLARDSAWTMLINSSLWFVPNLLICIAILLVFRRYLYHPMLGAALLAINLVYVVNIYTLWFSSKHSEAMFGFVFYLWLGSYAAHKLEAIRTFLARIHAGVLVTLTLLTGSAAFLESQWLAVLKNPEPSNTLRMTNQIFSICVVLMIFKIRRATWPSFIDVRRHTFGLYLSHPVVLMLVMHALRQMPLRTSTSQYTADVQGILAWLGASLVTYASCLGVTMWLESRPSLEWMVGLTGHDAPSLPVGNPASAVVLAA